MNRPHRPPRRTRNRAAGRPSDQAPPIRERAKAMPFNPGWTPTMAAASSNDYQGAALHQGDQYDAEREASRVARRAGEGPSEGGRQRLVSAGGYPVGGKVCGSVSMWAMKTRSTRARLTLALPAPQRPMCAQQYNWRAPAWPTHKNRFPARA